MRRVLTALVVYAALAAAFGVACGASGQVSPFTAVDFEDDGRVIVTLDGERVQLVSIAGLPVDELVAVSKREFGDDWQKRIGEDLLEVLGAAEVPLRRANAVDLEVRDDRGVRRVENAPMTVANRRAVWDDNKRKAEAERDADIAPVSLDVLAEVIRDRHAYATLRGVDLDALVVEEKRALGEEPSAQQVRRAAQRIIARLGDGHARVEDWNEAMPAGRMPFLMAIARNGIVVFENDRSRLVDETHPYIVSIDGVPIGQWAEAAQRYIPAGTRQLSTGWALRLMRYVSFLREELGLEHKHDVTFVLRNEDATETVELTRPLVDRRGIYGEWPRMQNSMLDDGIAYLRLSRMASPDGEWSDLRWTEWLREELARVTEGASGLIIDVRGNGGGRRVPIRALMPCLMDASDTPVVVNAARYRLEQAKNPGDPGGFLEDRFLYPAEWTGWTGAERAAIAAFAEGFEPAWHTPGEGFSDWHYMVVSPGENVVARLDVPVVVLMDVNCFSATDIFVAAMGELPNVTLVGTPTAGGSARSRRHAAGGLEVRLASMASFQPNGQLYDGVGVQPDVLVEKDPGDLVIGGGDAQLDRAIEILLAPANAAED